MTENEKNRRCRELPVLTACKTKWEGGESQLPCPIYDDKVKQWEMKLYSLELTDHNYRENYKSCKDKEVNELTRDEILTIMTHTIRTERFVTGTIAHALEDGTLGQMSVRLHELTAETDIA